MTENTPKQPEKPDEKPKEPEKQTNCLACSKPIGKIKRYYRDGKFYCNQRCWRGFIAKKKKAEEKQNNEEQKG